MATSQHTTATHPAAAPDGRVTAGLERSLTQVARAILRLEVPQHALPDGVSINKTGYWLLVRVSETAPVRLSDIAEGAELDVSTVSRVIRDLVTAELVTKVPDPADGRAALLSLTERGTAVLDAVSDARRRVLDEAVDGWTEEERRALADSLERLGSGLHHQRDHVAIGGAR